jgi:CRISPR-associated protein Cmr2
MNTYLLEISFGPVQSFIAAARRSRDLWAGSFILSEVARAAGLALKDSGAQLIYPLERRVRQDNPEEDSNLSNVLLASLEATDAAAVHATLEDAKQAGRDVIAAFAERAWRDWTGSGICLNKPLWRRQVDDALEAYAAWAEVREDGYRAAYDRLKRTFAARKNTRDFDPMFAPGTENEGAGIPKSSFDGLRESVLPKTRNPVPARFGLSGSEQLDALGCIKRVVGRQERFTALTRLAADGWLQSLTARDRDQLAQVYGDLTDHQLATGANGNEGLYRDFPFDGGLLYPERFQAAMEEATDPAATTALKRLGAVLEPLWRKQGRPNPYAALVVADGDRMGRFVDLAQDAKSHNEISNAVAGFADQVPGLARLHRGHCLFNGGEDLTVLYPVAGVVAGARTLARGFDGAMQDLVAKLVKGDDEARPTLRVGAAICHVLEPLGVIRSRGNLAEQFAKGKAGTRHQGNALGLRLHIRAGHEIGLRIRFDDDAGFDALASWQAAYGRKLVPGRLAYDTRAIALQCAASGVSPGVAEAEFLRLLARARQRGGDQDIPAIIRDQLLARRQELAKEAVEEDPSGLRRLADELILARWLSASNCLDLAGLEGGI